MSLPVPGEVVQQLVDVGVNDIGVRGMRFLGLKV